MVTPLLALLACAPRAGIPVSPTSQGKSTSAPIGINLAGPSDWNSELPFVDVFRTSRPWISQREGAAWGQGPKLDLDERGYVKRLEPGCFAETPMLTDLDGHFPKGDYTIQYKGKGRLEIWPEAEIRSSAPGRVVFRLDAGRTYGIFLRLRQTDPADPVRDVHVWMPGFADGKTEFHPAFLNRWRGVAAFRFMDWMLTNDSTVRTWADRPRPEDATWSHRGIPVEVMVRLCNEQDADGWFTLPHAADDEYVSRFAAYVAKNLEPGRKAYVEWSNEVWNAQFGQHRYAAQQGAKLGLASDQYHNAWRYTARRSVQIFNLFEKAFAGRPGLVRVLGAQAGWDEPAKQILAFENAGKQADVLAIAPYFGLSVGPGTTPKASEVSAWSVDRTLDHLEQVAIPQSADYVAKHAALAKSWKLKLASYEAGQHAVGIMGAENDDRLTKLLQDANRHPRMNQIYRRYLDRIAPAMQAPIMLFSSVGEYSKWGSWGMAEYYDQARTPKLDGVRAWAAAHGQTIGR